MTSLASGLKKRFSQYASFCVPVLFEKFKEKKQNVVLAIRDSLDAIYPSITLESIVDDVLEAMNVKNPSVKAETALFLARAFSNTQPSSLNKKLLKSYSGALIKNINEPGKAFFYLRRKHGNFCNFQILQSGIRRRKLSVR